MTTTTQVPTVNLDAVADSLGWPAPVELDLDTSCPGCGAFAGSGCAPECPIDGELQA